MWKIILSGLVMLNAQPNVPVKPRYEGAEKVHVLLVDARQTRIDSSGKPILAHTAVLEVPSSCLGTEAKPDWEVEIGGGVKRAFFMLDDTSLRIRSSVPQELEIVTGKRPLNGNGDLRFLPCCDYLTECPPGMGPRWHCDRESEPFSEQRRDLTWVTPMQDLAPQASLATECLPPRTSGCPLITWLTIEEGLLETHLLEGEQNGIGIQYVTETKIRQGDKEPTRAAAREILWSLQGELTIELVSFSGLKPVPLNSSCATPLRIRNEPLNHILEAHLESDHISQRHAEHLFRLLASPPTVPTALSKEGDSPQGSGLCPPGDTGGP